MTATTSAEEYLHRPRGAPLPTGAPHTPSRGSDMHAADMPACPDCGRRHPSYLAAALCCDTDLDPDRGA